MYLAPFCCYALCLVYFFSPTDGNPLDLYDSLRMVLCWWECRQHVAGRVSGASLDVCALLVSWRRVSNTEFAVIEHSYALTTDSNNLIRHPSQYFKYYLYIENACSSKNWVFRIVEIFIQGITLILCHYTSSRGNFDKQMPCRVFISIKLIESIWRNNTIT